MKIIDRPSANFNDRREGAVPDMVVLHFTAMEAEAALERLCDPGAEVSAHYVIGRGGEVWRLVDEEKRAWHAGAGAWGAVVDVNSRSIGIEMVNLGGEPFGAAQMDRLVEMLRAVMGRWAIAPERVIGHSDMAPERKGDPGGRFDWRRLALEGLSVWPDPGEAADFGLSAKRFGYRCGPELALQAFRQRFRPWTEGPEDAVDRGLMADLAARWPCLDGGGVGA